MFCAVLSLEEEWRLQDSVSIWLSGHFWSRGRDVSSVLVKVHSHIRQLVWFICWEENVWGAACNLVWFQLWGLMFQSFHKLHLNHS